MVRLGVRLERSRGNNPRSLRRRVMGFYSSGIHFRLIKFADGSQTRRVEMPVHRLISLTEERHSAQSRGTGLPEVSSRDCVASYRSTHGKCAARPFTWVAKGARSGRPCVHSVCDAQRYVYSFPAAGPSIHNIHHGIHDGRSVTSDCGLEVAEGRVPA